MRRRVDPVLLLILVVGLAARLYLAVTVHYVHDEENNAIPLSKTISFSPDSLHLPLRGENHGALPAYVVKFSRLLIPTDQRIGYRGLHVLLGLCTVVLVFRMTRDWYGLVAARWAAALIAFNGYFLPVSSRATAHAPFLFLIALSLYAFSRFLSSERAAYLYGAGAAAGLAFYCKEHAALLLPVYFLTLFHPRLRHWLRKPQAYVAALVFAAVLAPDLYWNVVTPDTTLVTYGDQQALQAHYTNHLRRIGGLGFSAYPMMFYGRSVVEPVFKAVTGRDLVDETSEYSSINPLLGLVLVGAVVATTILVRPKDVATMLFITMFWFVFGLFTVIARGNPPGRLDPVSWIWVESSMFPAIVLAGARLAEPGRGRRVLALVAAAALTYSVVRVLTSPVDGPQRGALTVVDVSTV